MAATPKERGKPLIPPAQLLRIRFSPCGTQLVAAGTDGKVHRWDATAAEPKPLPALAGHDGWVTTLAFHPDKTRLFTADGTGRLSCWDYAAKETKPLWTLPAAHDGWLRAITVSPDGKTLATCGRDRTVRTWDADGKPRQKVELPADVFCLAFTPTGDALAVGDLFGTIHHLDPATLKATRTIEVKDFHLLDRIQDVGGVRCLAFAPDGKTLFAAGAKPKTGGFVQAFPLVVCIDWTTGKRGPQWLAASDNEGIVHDLLRHPDGRLVGVSSGQPGNGKLFFWTPGEAKPSFESTAMANCHSMDLHPDGKLLAVSGTNRDSSGNGRPKTKGGEYPANHSPIQLWDVPMA